MTVAQKYPAHCRKQSVGKRMIVPLLVAMVMGVLYLAEEPDVVCNAAGGLFLITLLLVKEETSFYLLMFVLCANEMLNFGTTSIMMIFVTLYCIKSILLSGFRFRFYWSVVLSVAAVLAISVIAELMGNEEQLLTTIKLIFFLYYTARVLTKNTEKRQEIYINAFRFIAFGLNFFSLVHCLLNGMPSLSQRFTFHENVSINFLGIAGAVSIINLLYGMTVMKSRHFVLDMTLILGSCLWGVLTKSRSFILATVIGFVLIFFFVSSLQKKGEILLGVGIVVLLFFLIAVFLPSILDRLMEAMERIINPNNDDITNGRFFVWGETIQKMTQQGYIWFGAGDHTLLDVVYWDKVEVAHNFIIETWVIYGYIGCVALVAAFWCFIWRYVFNVPKARFNFVSLVPLVVVICALFFSHHFIGRSMSMVFALCWLPMTFGPTKHLEKGEHK